METSRRTAAELPTTLDEAIELLPGTPPAEALRAALDSAEPGAATIYVSLHGASSRKGKPRRLAEAALDLRRLHSSGRDLHRAPLPMYDAEGAPAVRLSARSNPAGPLHPGD